MTDRKLTVGVYGGRGYTGRELCRLLLGHKNVGRIIPASKGADDFDAVNPNLAGCGLKLISPEDLEARAKEMDVVFLRGDGGESLRQAPLFLEKGVKVIDLGADFRLTKETYEKVYGKQHTQPELLEEAAYGVTELNREQIKGARLVANPGCYVITGLLGLYPLLKEGMIQLHHIPINAINGTTGAKSEPEKGTMHTNVYGNILSYNMEGHRHSGEFEEQIEIFGGSKAKFWGAKVVVDFNVAHGDFTTGIHLVASPLVEDIFRDGLSREKLIEIYKSHYAGEQFQFIRINARPKSAGGTAKVYDVYPQIKDVRGTNYCDIGLDYDKERGIAKVIVATDNLVKGSAGSAIQNMNVMFGFDEAEGLRGYSAL